MLRGAAGHRAQSGEELPDLYSIAQIGSDTYLSYSFDIKATALNETTVATINGNNLGTYNWNGSSWVLVGTRLNISSLGWPSISTLNSTDIALADENLNGIRVYRWNGSVWTRIGNVFSLSSSFISIDSMTSTRIAHVNANGDLLKAFDWDGTDYTQVGSSFSLPSTSFGRLEIAALNATDIVYIDETNWDLTTYRFNGSTWSKIGNSLAITGTPSHWEIIAMNSEAITVVDVGNTTADIIRSYKWDGTNWTSYGTTFSVGNLSGSAYCAMAKLNSTDFFYLDSYFDNMKLMRYSPAP